MKRLHLKFPQVLTVAMKIKRFILLILAFIPLLMNGQNYGSSDISSDTTVMQCV